MSLLGIALEGVALQRFHRLPALAKMMFFALLDNLGYRQVNTWWRTKAYVTYYTRRSSLGATERAGHDGLAKASGCASTP